MNILAWLLVIVSFVFMYPWARWLLGASERVLTALTTVALSAGTLSLVMLWIGLLGQPIDWRTAALICALIGAAGIPFWLRKRAAAPDEESPKPPAWGRWAVIIIAVICVLILFNAVYWPFWIGDAVAIYAWYGKQIALSGHLPVGTLYEAYPMAVPLLYAFSHQAAGWIDEGLARLYPAVFSIGALGAAYLLGKWLYDLRTGILAALLIALTPMVSHWASTGYVDLPTAFFYGMSAAFIARWLRSEHVRDAFLAGLMAGLAAWIKNSGLLIGMALVLWWLYILLTPKCRNIRHALWMALGVALVAVPWYAHTLQMAGVIIPPTGWTWLAQRTLTNFFPYLTDTRYLPIGLLFTAGMWYTLLELLRKRDGASVLLSVFYFPFFAVWWLLVSYDIRFLMVLTSIVAVMAARSALVCVDWLVKRPISRSLIRAAQVALFIALIPLALLSVNAAVDFKTDLLRKPFLSLEERNQLALGPSYQVLQFMRSLPPTSRFLILDGLLPYHADGLIVVSPDQPYDYKVVNPDYRATEPNSPIFDASGFRVFRARP